MEVHMNSNRHGLDQNGRSRFEVITMYSLVALVLVATVVMLKPTGPLLEVTGPLWDPEPCKDSVAKAHYNSPHKCAPGATGKIREDDNGYTWWVCTCPPQEVATPEPVLPALPPESVP
jgi:hypothetical protein